MTKVEYIIGQLAGLDELRLARSRVKSEQELAYWKLAAESWFFQTQILRQFDRRQVRVDLGRNYPITITEEHPEVNLQGWSLVPDVRLTDSNYTAAINAVRMYTTFHRQPGEADPRGGYRSLELISSANAFVSLDDGAYKMVAMIEVIKVKNSLQRTLEELTRFALNIIRGHVKPETFTTVL